MAEAVRMPKLGMAMQSGQVVTWHRQVGGAVAAGDVLVTIESEKITYDIEAPAAGTLLWAAAEGADLPVGGLLAVLGTPGEDIAGLLAAEPGKATAAPAAAPAVTAAPPAAAAAPAPPAAAPAAAGPGRVRATPAARRLARERGVDLATVTPTGPGGQVTLEDVERAAAAPAGQLVPLDGVRRTIARRMHQSLQESAQVTLLTDFDATALVAARTRLAEAADAAGEPRPTYTDLIACAASRALPDYPWLNARLEPDGVRLLAQVHLGVAVALDEGLVVVVLRDAPRLSLAQIARQTRDLAGRARTRQLSLDEQTGSTFTVTNLGMYDVDGFTPILNPPEVAILGVGRVVEKAGVVQGQVVPRPFMTLSLTFDHRVVDGAPAARFLQRLRQDLEAARFPA